MNTPSDPERIITLSSLDGREIRVGRENCILFTFIGESALYNHVYVFAERDSESPFSFLIFDALLPEQYRRLKDHVETYQYKQVLNETKAPEFDVQAFDNCIKQMVISITGPEDGEQPQHNNIE